MEITDDMCWRHQNPELRADTARHLKYNMPATPEWITDRVARGGAMRIGYKETEKEADARRNEPRYVMLLQAEYDYLLACKKELESQGLVNDWYAKQSEPAQHPKERENPPSKRTPSKKTMKNKGVEL